jgi:hypothetical protein
MADKKKTRAGKQGKRSTQNQLNLFFRNGFLGLVAGILFGVLIFLMHWPNAWYFLPIVLAGFGITMLICAWFTRQGLVHNRLMKLITRLMRLN